MTPQNFTFLCYYHACFIKLEVFIFLSCLTHSLSLSDFTGVITTSMSASMTTLMSTVRTTLARCPMSGPSDTSSTWWTMTATAPATTPPRASNAGSATGLCRPTGRWSSQRSSSCLLPFPWASSSVLAESIIIYVSMQWPPSIIQRSYCTFLPTAIKYLELTNTKNNKKLFFWHQQVLVQLLMFKQFDIWHLWHFFIWCQ